MGYRVRPARHDDISRIVPWTSDTFAWGDYVPVRLPEWLADPNSQVLVSVDDSDLPLAMCHVVMLSPTEGWLEGARVHPEHKRKGLGSALNQAGVAWARERGARVVRLATEAVNLPARTQVERLGYRQTSSWVYADLDVDSTYRSPDQYRLRRAPPSDADAAWLFWAVSDLAREGRELIAQGWRWRQARPGDIANAAANGDLCQSPAGWAIVEQPHPERLRAPWLATTREDALRLLDGLMDLAAERGAELVDLKLPNIPWTAEALTRAGAAPDEILVFSKTV